MAYEAELALFRDEYLPNVQSSSYHPKWVAANPGEAARWAAFRDAILAAGDRVPPELVPPELVTKYGRGLVAAGRMHMGISKIVGAMSPAPQPPDAGPGEDIVLVNQRWSPSGNWGPYDLVDVRILESDPRRDAVHLSGTGTVARFYGEQFSADMFKVHQDADGCQIGSYAQQSEFYSRMFTGVVHQDGIQAMGGGPATFTGFYMQKDIGGNSHFFCNQGAGGSGRPHDVVVEFSVINGYRGDDGRGGGRPVRISDSERCGVRHCLVIYATDPGIPLLYNGPIDPVNVDSFSMTHAQWDSIGGNASGPRHRDLWNADGSHKPLLDSLIAAGTVAPLVPSGS